jgi:phosphohistidine phosphatase
MSPQREEKIKDLDERDEDRNPPGGMRVYLMRHGIAIDRDDPDCPPEAERFLTPKGVQRTRTAARGLRELKVRPTTILSSPYVRAVQTGEIVCEILGLDCHKLRTTEALKSEAKPSRLADELAEIGSGDVICFGHAPHLDDFIAHAVRATSAFTALKKSGVARLEIDGFSPLQASLDWLMTSRVLRRLGE